VPSVTRIGIHRFIGTDVVYLYSQRPHVAGVSSELRLTPNSRLTSLPPRYQTQWMSKVDKFAFAPLRITFMRLEFRGKVIPPS